MKMIKKNQVLGLTILVAFLVGCVSWFAFSNSTEVKTVNGVEQTFPMKLSNDFEIVEAHLDEYELTIFIKDKHTDEVYESTLPSEDLEEIVCNLKYHNAEGSYNEYRCETEEDIVKSMITELGKQTIELIKEEK